jgi:hypothetical protein
MLEVCGCEAKADRGSETVSDFRLLIKAAGGKAPGSARHPLNSADGVH